MAELNDINLRIVVTGTGIDSIRNTASAFDSMARAMATASANAGVQAGSWKSFGDELSNLERKFDAVFRAASHLQALGRDITGIGEAGIGALKESVEQWGNYEFAVHRAAGALGIFDTTSPIFHSLQSAIDETAQSARLFPADEIAKATYYWGSATGQTVQNEEDLAIVMKGLLPIMQTAAITETSYEQAIKGTYQIVQQYQLGLTRLATAQDVANGSAKHVGEEISNVGDITEKLMMITQNTAVEYTDLIESFKYAGSIAPSLGVSYEEMALVLGRLGDLGIRGSSAGRALQQTFAKLVDPTVKASTALDAAWQANYGLNASFESMVFPNGEFIGLTEYVDMLADVTEDMTTKERDNLIAIMTTQNELRTMIPLVEDQIRARKEGISVYDDEKYNLALASKQFEQTMHLLEISWKGTMGYLKESIGPVVRAIGQATAAMVAPFVEGLGNMFIEFKKWLDLHPEVTRLAVKIVAIGSIIAVVAGAFFTVTGVVLAFGAGIAFVIKALGMAFIGFKSTIDVVDDFGNVLGKRQVYVQGVLRRFFPIFTAIAAAVAAMVAIWVNNFGGLRDALLNVWDALKEVFAVLDFSGAGGGFDILKVLGEMILPPLEVVARLAAGALNLLADGLRWVAGNEQATAVLQGLVGVLITFISLQSAVKMMNLAGGVLTLGRNGHIASGGIAKLHEGMVALFRATRNHGMAGMFDVIKTGAAGALAAVKAKMAGIVGVVRGAALAVSTSIKGVLIASGIGLIILAVALLYEAWTNNWGGIQEKVGAVVDWVSDRLSEFASWIGGIWTTISSGVSSFVSDVQSFFATFVETASTNIGNFVRFWQELPGKIGTFMGQVWTNVTTWVGQIVAAIIAFPGTVLTNITTGFNNILTFISEWWTGLGDSTAERIGYLVGVVIAFPIKMWIEWIKLFASIAEMLLTWFDEQITNFENWIVSVFNTVVEWFSQLPGKIAEFFGMIGAALAEWWTTTIANVTTWATNTYTSITTWIGKLPGKIGTFFSQVWTNVSTWFGKLVTDVGTWASNMINKITSFVEKLPGRIAGFFSTVYTNTSTWFINVFIPNIGTWASNAVKAVVDWFIKLPGRVADEVGLLVGKLRTFFVNLPGKIIEAVKNVGGAIVRGIWNGITNLWGWFTDQVTGFFNGIIAGIKDTLDMRSPSKVFANIGSMMIEGVAVGIHQNSHAVSEMNHQVDELIHSSERLRAAEFSATAGSLGFESTAERTVNVNVDVTSKDGTVNSASRETIREIFTTEDFISSLEHMVTVG